MKYELKDRVVLITGASSGIGRACAVEFHRAGGRVIGLARSIEKLEELRRELGTQRFKPLSADVTDRAQRDAALALAREHFGPIDVLVNNAGWASFGSLQRTPVEHVDRMLTLNLRAPLELIQAVLPDMIRRQGGQIINISSVVGFQAIPRMGFYSATKAALNSLTTALRMELRGSGIDVLLVAPGSTNTPFFQSAAQIDTKAVRLADTQYSPQRVARAVVRASRRRRAETILTVEGKLITWIRRASHRLADRIMIQVAKRSMPLRDELTDSLEAPFGRNG
jgi:short-subunit dehydrogenase